MSIPDEAFKDAEATYREVLTDLRLKEGGGFKVPSQTRRALCAALEAAAPYLKAEAWDEGNIAGVFDLPSEKHATTNPYRSQA